MAQQGKRLEWSACFNVRDVGGYGTREGAVTRRGALVRADSLTRLDDRGQRALLDYGIRTVVDLRHGSELRSAASPFAGRGSARVAYVNAPIIDERGAATPAIYAATAAEETYALFLEHCRRGIAAAVRAVARAGEGGVVVHCQIGRDRTGLVVALLLALAGVEPREVAREYALSKRALAPLFAEWLRGSADERDRRRLARESRCSARAMLETLTHLDRAYGGAAAYLACAGVDAADLRRLRARLVGAEPATRRAA